MQRNLATGFTERAAPFLVEELHCKLLPRPQRLETVKEQSLKIVDFKHKSKSIYVCPEIYICF
jgi:hypothetical protein